MDGAQAIVGVDVGGTFTDLVLLEAKGTQAALRVAKVPTTTANQAEGVLAALGAAEAAIADLAVVVHGTTTTTNALLERRLARTGLITTQGFRDSLELGRRTRPHPYGMTGVFEPLIPRELRIEVPERIDYRGRVIVPLDEAAVEAAAQRLLADGCEAVVVHFLHAYADPTHERRAGEIVRRVWPNGYVTLAHELLSEYREFERGTTAAVNASVQPVLERYVSRLQRGLEEKGFAGELLVMQGNGGTVSARRVALEAAKTVMSGPASGVMAAAWIARQAGFPDIITYDMGGTSTDVALVRGGVPAVSDELELEYAMPIHVPMVDVHTIGAGGGSIARVDAAGLLQVGPESAGAVPGPVCFGRGGTRPTITDANLLLGRLDPASLLAVDRAVDMDAVTAAMGRHVGEPLGLDATDAAAAVLRLAVDRMAGAMRMVSLARGYDPRDCALFAFGGAGPLHASALAREMGIPRLLIPVRPGLINAIGCLVADLRHDFTRTLNLPIDQTTPAQLAEILSGQASAGRERIAAERLPVETITVLHAADMQFRGQTHLLHVPLDADDLDAASLRRRFERVYLDRFGIELPEFGAMLVNLKTSVIGRRRVPEPEAFAAVPARSLRAAQLSDRRVWFAGTWRATPVYARDRLPPDVPIIGPAILQQFDSTIVLEPGDRARRDRLGNLVVTVS
ncbi:MAG: hydantoinase/oxoprolinase family protein [Geminicoccaceae bacterium]